MLDRDIASGAPRDPQRVVVGDGRVCRRPGGTGSHPPGFQGWHRTSRRPVSQPPRTTPWIRTASTAYDEQEGANRHTGPTKGDNVSWYRRRTPMTAYRGHIAGRRHSGAVLGESPARAVVTSGEPGVPRCAATPAPTASPVRERRGTQRPDAHARPRESPREPAPRPPEGMLPQPRAVGGGLGSGPRRLPRADPRRTPPAPPLRRDRSGRTPPTPRASPARPAGRLSLADSGRTSTHESRPVACVPTAGFPCAGSCPPRSRPYDVRPTVPRGPCAGGRR